MKDRYHLSEDSNSKDGTGSLPTAAATAGVTGGSQSRNHSPLKRNMIQPPPPPPPPPPSSASIVYTNASQSQSYASQSHNSQASTSHHSHIIHVQPPPPPPFPPPQRLNGKIRPSPKRTSSYRYAVREFHKTVDRSQSEEDQSELTIPYLPSGSNSNSSLSSSTVLRHRVVGGVPVITSQNPHHAAARQQYQQQRNNNHNNPKTQKDIDMAMEPHLLKISRAEFNDGKTPPNSKLSQDQMRRVGRTPHNHNMNGIHLQPTIEVIDDASHASTQFTLATATTTTQQTVTNDPSLQHQQQPLHYPPEEPCMPDATYEETYGDAYVGSPIRYVYPKGYQTMRPRSGPWKLSIVVFCFFTWMCVFIVGHCSDQAMVAKDDDIDEQQAAATDFDDDALIIETRWCGSRVLYAMWVITVIITALAAAYCSIIGYIQLRDFSVANTRSQPPGMVGKSEYYVRIGDVHRNYDDPKNNPGKPVKASIYQSDGQPQFWGGHIYRPTQAAVAVTSR